jgi:hypothetical protein
MHRALAFIMFMAPFAVGENLMDWRLDTPPPMANVIGPLSIPDHRSTPDHAKVALPIADVPIPAHVRAAATENDWPKSAASTAPELPGAALATTASVAQNERTWVGTRDGLYYRDGNGDFARHPTYGVDGPPSNVIADIAVESRRPPAWRRATRRAHGESSEADRVCPGKS